MFYPYSVAVARYAALIRIKFPTNWDSQLTKSLFQTRSRKPVRDYSYTLRFFFQSYNRSSPVHRLIPDETFCRKAEVPCHHPVPFCNTEHIPSLHHQHYR
uniref:DUF6783 domain-containing protein n=1 Tax=Blautia faecicola TaxID=2509240 RepID=UPI00351FEF95